MQEPIGTTGGKLTERNRTSQLHTIDIKPDFHRLRITDDLILMPLAGIGAHRFGTYGGLPVEEAVPRYVRDNVTG